MKFSTVFLAFTAVATVSAARVDTNAYRMARGLPPNPPAKRSTPALGMHAKPFPMVALTKSLGAKRTTASGIPQCKPALAPCSSTIECCSDICLLGVSVPLSEFMNVSMLKGSDYSFAFNWRTEIVRVRVCVPYREFHIHAVHTLRC
jgi:hypothetical protein